MRVNEQLLKTSGADVLSSGKTQKNLPPPPMNVRGLKDGMQSGYINCSILL